MGLETLIVIFQNFSPKGFFLIMKNFEISVLTGILDSRSAIYSWVQNINKGNKRVVRLPIVTIEG